MKKIIVLLIAILISLLSFSGCKTPSKSKKQPAQTKTITLWHYYNGGIKAQFDDLVQTFNETVGKEKGIIVDAYSQGGVNELADAVFASANKDVGSKKMPDIFAAYPDNALRLDNLGVVARLDEYFTKDELNSYKSEFLEDGRFDKDKSLKIIPVAKSTELLYINMTAFNEFAKATGATLDELSTWESLSQTAEKYYKWSNGKAMFGIDSMSNFMIIAAKQLGKDFFTINNNNASLNINAQDARKIWDAFYIPFVKGHYSAVGRFRSDDLRSGNIIMFTGSNSSASFFPKIIETGKDSSYETQSCVIPYPCFAGKEKVAVHQGAGMVVSKSDNETQKACAEFLKWFTSPEQNLKFAATTSYLPVKNETLTYEKMAQYIDSTDESDIKLQTNKAVFKMLDSYKIYSPKPFNNGVETRNIINTSLLNKAQSDLKGINEKTKSANKEDVMAQYISDENFNAWYNDFTTKINNELKK